MTKKITINVFSDPGHGWARVPKTLLTKLGISAKISTYSYQRGDYAYLEEDCDLGVLINALKSKNYVDINFKENHTNRQSKIRGYATYRSE
jgi:hypothetical protein